MQWFKIKFPNLLKMVSVFKEQKLILATSLILFKNLFHYNIFLLNFGRTFLRLELNVGISYRNQMEASPKNKGVISELGLLCQPKKIKMLHHMNIVTFWKSYLPMSYREPKQKLLPGKALLVKKPSIFYNNMPFKVLYITNNLLEAFGC